MPDFQLSEGEALALTLFLLGDDAVRLRQVRTQHPTATAARGREIFVALNCAGCHTYPGIRSWRNAPDLRRSAGRLRPEWLAGYLRGPHAVRPFGFYPGSGSRMPDFRLTAVAADSIQAYLTRRALPFDGRRVAPPDTTLSAYSMVKAETLLRERLSCLGCHRLGSDGGRIGPALGDVATRLTPEAIAAIVAGPQAAMPGTIMPRAPLTPERRELITAFLLQRAPDAGDSNYLSLIDHPIRPPGTGTPARPRAGAAIYAAYCAVCHGAEGEGNGYNARYLPVQPTPHASAPYMSTRPDDTLFDGIHAGGYILNRSHRMPAWGETLERGQIWRLVSYLRVLCDCQGPAWSRDGRTPDGVPDDGRTRANG
ncbi:MAG: c-type cytochrome [Longimicrobiales bacterium]